MALPISIVACLLLTSVSGNIAGDYCDVLDEYDNFKISLDNFLASRDELCKSRQIRSDCASIKTEFPDATDGVYRIKPRDGKPSFLAYCDMTQQGGGWLVIQRRQDGSEDFYRTWFEYKDGFGNLTGEFWLGNEKIHRLTNQRKYELRVDLEKKNGDTKYAEYNFFRIANMSEFYNLTINGYSGNAGDHFKEHNNTRFSAKNLDLDTWTDKSCAQDRHGAWWFTNCVASHLNGLYTGSGGRGIWWNGNIEGDYCEVVEEYNKFKVSFDNYLASKDQVCSNTQIRSDCTNIKSEFPEATDGVYRIKPRDGKPSFLAYCDMTEQGGGWLVIQRRQDGSEDFFRNWFDYMNGFGNLTGEFWLGNEKIHRLTNQGTYELRVDLQKEDGEKVYAVYSHFLVNSMSEFYQLSINGYEGNASDSLKRQNENKFSAKNIDLDKHHVWNCADKFKGGWWYESCFDSNLNGLYSDKSENGIYWDKFGTCETTTMKIRPI